MWLTILIIIAVGILAYTWSKASASSKEGSTTGATAVASDDSEGCCGAHEVCDKDSLLATSATVVYYDDEELDKYAGMRPEDYRKDQIDEFKEILYTMRDEDVAGWLRSLKVRNINLPYEVREEALMIVADIRDIIRGDRKMAGV